ncbi:MAG TPA: cytochrome c biogenesis protein CcsA [Polyangia bacterium]|nr:cytochrome c biogenesis protein CcsA [Polyangia bacterium]
MKKMFVLTLSLAALGLLVSPWLILRAPQESTMGLVQKIFYYHVPTAMVDFLTIYLCGIASVAFLVKRSPRADALAVASAELAVVFGACTLWTGSMWARKAWGVWWTWDVRLTTFALCEMVFIGYLLVRSYGGPGSRGLAAALALFGCADVPLIYVSVSIWRTMHPQTTVVPNLVKPMAVPFWVAVFTMLMLYLALLLARLLHERNRTRVDELYVAAAEAGLEE